MNYEKSITEFINQCFDTFESNVEFADQAKIVFDKIKKNIRFKIVNQDEMMEITGSTQTVGVADYRGLEIWFLEESMVLNWAVYLQTVVAHEVAHILSKQLFGMNIRDHGKEFKKVCKLLGFPESGTSSFILEDTAKRRKMSSYHYECECDDYKHIFSAKSHNKTVKLGLQYKCNFCKHTLIFKEKI